jgi:hypothetical protein
MPIQIRPAPRTVAWRLTLLMSLVVGIVVVATCWLLGVETGLALLLGGLGFAVSVAVIGSTLLLMSWWIGPASQPVDFPRLRFDPGTGCETVTVDGGAGTPEHYLVLNDVSVSNESGRRVEIGLRLRVYYSDDEYMIWWASPSGLPGWEAARASRQLATTPPLALPMVLAPGDGSTTGYVGFRVDDHRDAMDLLRSNRDRLRFVLEATDRESKAVRTTEVEGVEWKGNDVE